MIRIPDQEDTPDGIEGVAGQAGQGIDGRSRALRVAFEDEALVHVAAEARVDAVDDVGRAGGAVLREGGGVDGVVDFAAADLALDVALEKKDDMSA